MNYNFKPYKVKKDNPLGLIPFVICKYYTMFIDSPVGEHLLYWGYLGYRRAVNSYDPGRTQSGNVNFTTYACTCISSAISSYMLAHDSKAVNKAKHEYLDFDCPMNDKLTSKQNISRLDVNKLVCCLSEKEKAVVKLRYFDGLRDKEIAEALKCHYKSIPLVLSRAILKMREYAGVNVENN